MHGVLNINKPAGMSSHDVVLHVRRLLSEKRVGHTGTLDPLATGVLVLCVGKATRIARFLEAGEKEYRAVMQLGVATDTLDAEGKVLEERDYVPPDRTRIQSALAAFTGEIIQAPPVYSALKVRGVSSYKLARQGKPEQPKPRTVKIHSIELIEHDDLFITLTVRCSKGVYIRSLCSDLGEALETLAHLTGLVRIRSGRFKITDAVSLEQLAILGRERIAKNLLVPIDEALQDMPSITVSSEEAEKIGHGNRIITQESFPGTGTVFARVHNATGNLVALARTGGGELKPELVFSGNP